MAIEFRVVDDPEELKEIVHLQTVVWSMPASEAVPHNMLHAVVHGGGNVIRADLDGQLVGFTLGIVALRDNTPIIWSHMAGVVPSLQGKGIGQALKFAQRRWALEHGFKTIAWTFDPLQRGNANFNMHHLRATASQYHINFYGTMTDGINAGMPSDRLESVWDLLDERVVQAENLVTHKPDIESFPLDQFLLYSDELGHTHVKLPAQWNKQWYFAEIPYNVTRLKRENLASAMSWQGDLRIALRSAFEQGFTAVDFAEDGVRCWYVLTRE